MFVKNIAWPETANRPFQGSHRSAILASLHIALQKPPAHHSTGRRASSVRVSAFQKGVPSASSGSVPPKTEEIDRIKLVMEDLASKKRVIIAQVAPAVRVSIGEELGLPPGTAATGKLVSALRLLGFDFVFDVLAGADMTIMEEGTELLHRLHDHLEGKPDAAPLPMFTSCCPGWIEFVEKCVPELIPHVSTAKSPHMMEGTLIKTFFSEALGRHDTDLEVVSIMPCVRKQGEADRISFQTPSGARDVDHVLTTRDIAALISEKGIDFAALPDSHFDDFMGIGSGAAAIFGTTGGVMEAALRTVVEIAGGQAMPRPEYSVLRGFEGVREATVTIPPNPEGPLHNTEPVDVHVAVANGLGNAKKLLKAVQDGTTDLQFVEVMACPGGCIGGGGQPRSKDKDILAKRQAALYDLDEQSQIRRSYENPIVKEIYSRYLGGEPCGERARELLHQSYTECGPGKFDITAPPPPANACVLPEGEECDTEVCEVSEEEWE